MTTDKQQYIRGNLDEYVEKSLAWQQYLIKEARKHNVPVVRNI